MSVIRNKVFVCTAIKSFLICQKHLGVVCKLAMGNCEPIKQSTFKLVWGSETHPIDKANLKKPVQVSKRQCGLSTWGS